MVRLRGPLLSLDAAGQLAKTLIFRAAGRGHTVYPYFKPKQPGMEPQTEWHALFSQLAAAWSAYTPEQKAEWDDAAAAQRITPYNAYLAANLKHEPPPPICPPEQITGHIEAGPGAFVFPDGYSSEYTAQALEPDSLQFTEDTGPLYPNHLIIITLSPDTQTYTIALRLYDANGNRWLWAAQDQPFTWCTHNHLTCDTWARQPPGSSGCTVTLNW